MIFHYPQINPIAFSIGPLHIHWYALAYISGIFLGYRLALRDLKTYPSKLTPKDMDDIVNWVVCGILLGGRLGYCLFYFPSFYLSHPLEILKMWQGGMSFHGGFLGVIIAVWFFARQRGQNFWHLIDRVAMVVPIGLFFGRLANFINAELYGRVADVPWAMIFPHGGPLPRHPSQLYEAFLEGIILFTILRLAAKNGHILKNPSTASALFLCGYGLSRFLVECFREPDRGIGYFGGALTLGQIYCLPMIALGVYLGIKNAKQT